MDLQSIVNDVLNDFGGLFGQMEVAEEEIEYAQKRHGEPLLVRDEEGKALNLHEMGPIWNSFLLVQPTHNLMETEFVYRSHCAELLDRVAAGEDTRPATKTEMVLALLKTSHAAPLRGWATGLTIRLFHEAFPVQARQAFDDGPFALTNYEAMYGPRMDEEEAELRHRLRQEWRVPKTPEQWAA